MTILIMALTLLFGVNTICPTGSYEIVTPIGPEDNWDNLDCNYFDAPPRHICGSIEDNIVTWAIWNPGILVTAVVLEYENGDTVTETFDPYAYFVNSPRYADDVFYESGSGQAMETIAWCGRTNNRVFLSVFRS